MNISQISGSVFQFAGVIAFGVGLVGNAAFAFPVLDVITVQVKVTETENCESSKLDESVNAEVKKIEANQVRGQKVARVLVGPCNVTKTGLTYGYYSPPSVSRVITIEVER